MPLRPLDLDEKRASEYADGISPIPRAVWKFLELSIALESSYMNVNVQSPSCTAAADCCALSKNDI